MQAAKSASRPLRGGSVHASVLGKRSRVTGETVGGLQTWRLHSLRGGSVRARRERHLEQHWGRRGEVVAATACTLERLQNARRARCAGAAFARDGRDVRGSAGGEAETACTLEKAANMEAAPAAWGQRLRVTEETFGAVSCVSVCASVCQCVSLCVCVYNCVIPS